MKTLSRILCASLLLTIVLLPLGALGDQLPAPMVKKIPQGTTVVQYYGQSLRFETSVPLRLQFEPVETSKFKLTVRAMGGQSGPDPGYQVLDIYWTDFGTTVYSGSPPASGETWEGTLNTESGFTEK